VRWSADGLRVAGATPDGDAVVLDLARGRIAAQCRGALPLDADGTWLVDGEVRDGASIRRRGLREASWALSGHRLAGPGGVVWDLRTGTRLFDEPVVRFGAAIATPGRWATVDWETGAGVWFDPDSGEVRATFVLPLDEDEVVDGGWFSDGATVALSSGRTFLLRENAPAEERAAPPPTRQQQPTRWVEATTAVDGRIYGWNADGLLIGWPQFKAGRR
jgi:hypothetical protein